MIEVIGMDKNQMKYELMKQEITTDLWEESHTLPDEITINALAFDRLVIEIEDEYETLLSEQDYLSWQDYLNNKSRRSAHWRA